MGSTTGIVYCTVFGVAFVVSSTLYLFTLNQVEVKGHCATDTGQRTTLESLPLTTTPLPSFENQSPRPSSSSSDSLEDDCLAGMRQWKVFAKTGIIYGLVCFFLGIFHLGIVCWRAYLANDLREPTILLQTLRKKDRSWKAVAISIATIHQRLLHKGLGRNVIEEAGFWHGCAKCFRGFYVVVTCAFLVAIWLASIVVPAYIASGLVRTHALYPQKDQLYGVALALFIICLTSVTFVIVSAFVIVCFRGYTGEFWNFVELSSSSECVDQVPATPADSAVTVQKGEQNFEANKDPERLTTSIAFFV